MPNTEIKGRGPFTAFTHTILSDTAADRLAFVGQAGTTSIQIDTGEVFTLQNSGSPSVWIASSQLVTDINAALDSAALRATAANPVVLNLAPITHVMGTREWPAWVGIDGGHSFSTRIEGAFTVSSAGRRWLRGVTFATQTAGVTAIDVLNASGVLSNTELHRVIVEAEDAACVDISVGPTNQVTTTFCDFTDRVGNPSDSARLESAAGSIMEIEQGFISPQDGVNFDAVNTAGLFFILRSQCRGPAIYDGISESYWNFYRPFQANAILYNGAFLTSVGDIFITAGPAILDTPAAAQIWASRATFIQGTLAGAFGAGVSQQAMPELIQAEFSEPQLVAVGFALGNSSRQNIVLTASTQTMTLPAAPYLGMTFRFQNAAGVINSVIAGGAKTINGGASLPLALAYDKLTAQYNGTEWLA